MELKPYLSEKKKRVEAELLHSIHDGSTPKSLVEAMAYSLNAGGKRLRPILCIAGAEAVGGSEDRVMNAAIALEMIHTFSLIHDDLPAMDNDSLRRGKPTNHKVYGDAMAILAGDGLLAEAFYVLASTKDVEPAALIETIADVASASGGRGMTGGQALDMNATGRKISEEELTNLHDLKTGALITASVTAGARLCGASKEDVAALADYGRSIGLAFQIADDILDIEGDQSVIGKDIGSDEAKGKSTYPAIIGLENSRKKAATLIDRAITSLSRFGRSAEPLRLIAKYIVERKA